MHGTCLSGSTASGGRVEGVVYEFAGTVGEWLMVL